MSKGVRGLVLRCGDADPAVAAQHGCFAAWFRRAIDPGVHLGVLDVRTDPIDPARLDDVDILVISGSPHAVYEDHGWIPALEAFVREAVLGRRMPVLGVCFGHQMVARALGGTVTRNPRGREIGTIEVELNDEGVVDPLFEGLPRRFSAQAAHRDTVVQPPPGATVLGRSARDDCQAFRVGSAWGVQFHPEVSAAVMRGYVTARAELIRAEGMCPDAIGRAVLEEVEGLRVIENFIRVAAGRLRRAA